VKVPPRSIQNSHSLRALPVIDFHPFLLGRGG
jgi:hypothetical protein